MAGDQEQRVVDADPEAHHHRDGRGGGADVGHGGQQGDPGRGDAEAGEGHQQRQPGGHDRPQDERQQQQRHDDAGDLAGALHLLGRGVRQLAAELHLEAVGGPVHRALQRVHPEAARQVGVGDGHVEDHGQQRGVPVLGEARRYDRRDVLDLRHPGGQLGEIGVAQPAAGRVVHDDLGGAAGRARPGEVLAQLLGAGQRGGALDVEVVLGRAAEGAGGQRGRDGDEQPGRERAPRVRRRAAAEPVQEPAHDRSPGSAPEGARDRDCAPMTVSTWSFSWLSVPGTAV